MANQTGARPLPEDPPEEKYVGDPKKPNNVDDPSIAEATGMYGDIATAEEYGYVHRG